MSTTSTTLCLFTRTPLHLGAGKSVGIVDAPIARERHTRIPIIPGSSLKGVLRDLWHGDAEAVRWLFGPETKEANEHGASAGALLIGEARVLAFPVRSAKGAFAWLTCPLVLNRFKRDTGAKFEVPKDLQGEKAIAAEQLIFTEGAPKAIFEEYCLEARPLQNSELLSALTGLTTDEVWQELPTKLAIVSDELFSYFVENACEVVYRIRIDDETGTVDQGGLFNQENVPSETLFYTTLAAQPGKGAANKGKSAADALAALRNKLADHPVLQLGGDETIGLGYCTANLAAN